MKPKLRIHSESFSDDELKAWKAGDYSLIEDCSRLLKRRLRGKAVVRPGRRYFGEAKVLASERYREASYGSFKWLTSPKWTGDQALPNCYQECFRDALMKHFPDLREFQQGAAVSTRKLGCRRPVGPDLWLIGSKEHRFIEVKLPGDHLAPHQLAGLALIGMFLRSDRSVSVEIINLFSGEKPRGAEREIKTEFARICRQLKKARAAHSSLNATRR